MLRFVASGVFLLMGIVSDPQRRQIHRHRQPPDAARHVGGVSGRARGDSGQSQGDPVLHGRAAGFFDLTTITGPDMAAIVAISMLVPFAGNLCFALFVDRARRLLASPGALRRTNVIAGSLLILVGLVIPFT